jgi:hypothetical protein
MIKKKNFRTLSYKTNYGIPTNKLLSCTFLKGGRDKGKEIK